MSQELDIDPEKLALKRENHAALETIKKLLVEMNQLREKNAHLESLLAQTVPVIKEESKLIASIDPETEIAVHQLDRIRNAAKVRALTLEEARIFDLLVKNKRIVQEDNEKARKNSVYRDVSDIELMKLVSSEAKLDDSE